MKYISEIIISTALLTIATGFGGSPDQGNIERTSNTTTRDKASQQLAMVSSDPQITGTTNGEGFFFVDPNGTASSDWWIEVYSVVDGTREKITDGHHWVNEGGSTRPWAGELDLDLSGTFDVEVHTDAGKVDSARVIQW